MFVPRGFNLFVGSLVYLVYVYCPGSFRCECAMRGGVGGRNRMGLCARSMSSTKQSLGRGGGGVGWGGGAVVGGVGGDGGGDVVYRWQ